ncbi:Uncharacterised protein [Serratia ficaria]|uniref:HNH endonuclease n=2 Tax=Serratia ficaria TaxID=61651 RepID=UPI002183827A|nr:HNH endonuclease [Serratia ficaria]CAI2490443.1 Uncharacterised protein [Serratia ficaria]
MSGESANTKPLRRLFFYIKLPLGGFFIEVNMNATELRKILEYDELSGDFRWVKTVSPTGVSGDIAGSVGRSGYHSMVISGKRYYAHRLAWLYVNGSVDGVEIDHINGVKHDNRISNLRIATHSQNQMNRKKPKNNTSGFKGVSWSKRAKKWRVDICANGVRKTIGLFEEKIAAIEAHSKYSEILHGEFKNTGCI